MAPSWFIEKNTEPTVRAMHSVLRTLRRALTTVTASRQLPQVFALGFIPASFPGLVLNLGMSIRRYVRTDTEIRLDAELGRPANQFGLRLDAELDVDGGQVALHRALAEEQPLGDLRCGLPAGGEQGDLALPPAQRVHAERRAPPGPALASG